jgi:hypothetical protein
MNGKIQIKNDAKCLVLDLSALDAVNQNGVMNPYD